MKTLTLEEKIAKIKEIRKRTFEILKRMDKKISEAKLEKIRRQYGN